MQAGSAIHFSLRYNSFLICISSRKLDLGCLNLYAFVLRTEHNGNEEDVGVIIIKFTTIYGDSFVSRRRLRLLMQIGENIFKPKFSS
jgi:hypothetical protein